MINNTVKLNRINTIKRASRGYKILPQFTPTPSQSSYIPIKPNKQCNYEIFAYCSQNYEDAYNFVIDSWTRPSNITKVTIYTDWPLQPKNSKVIVRPLFEKSNSWIIGTGRRLDVIKHFSEENKNNPKNILFLDMDCYLVSDVSEVFSYPFDMAISRLYSGSKYTNLTATAGLWFAKLSSGYYNFIEDWFKIAKVCKDKKIGIQDYRISYVQYSFTKVAKTRTPRYTVFPIDEKIYNSEHSNINLWFNMIRQYHPKILHFKGRSFRNPKIVKTALELSGAR